MKIAVADKRCEFAPSSPFRPRRHGSAGRQRPFRIVLLITPQRGTEDRQQMKVGAGMHTVAVVGTDSVHHAGFHRPDVAGAEVRYLA